MSENFNNHDSEIEKRKVLKSVKLFLVLLFLIFSFLCVNPIVNTYSSYISQIDGNVSFNVANPIIELDEHEKNLIINQNIIFEQPFSIRNFDNEKISDTAFNYNLIFSITGIENTDYEIVLKNTDNNTVYNVINNKIGLLNIGIESSITQNYIATVKFINVSPNMKEKNFGININVEAEQVEVSN